jgi:hypothetical protein
MVWLVLDLLLERSQVWGIGELVDEIGSPIAVAEALDALQDAGLIECTNRFVRIRASPPCPARGATHLSTRRDERLDAHADPSSGAMA